MLHLDHFRARVFCILGTIGNKGLKTHIKITHFDWNGSSKTQFVLVKSANYKGNILQKGKQQQIKPQQ